MPWTNTSARAFDTWNRDVHAGHALVSPGPFGDRWIGIGARHRDLSGRCPSRNGFSVDKRFSWTQPCFVVCALVGDKWRRVGAAIGAFSPSDAARHTFGRSKATVAEAGDRRREGSVASGAGTNYKYNRKGALFTPPNCAYALLRIKQGPSLVCALICLRKGLYWHTQSAACCDAGG